MSGRISRGGSAPPWARFAYVAFIVVGTERLRIDRQLWLAVVALATVAVIMPILGYDTTRLFAAAVPFLALSVALAVAVIERVPVPTGARVTAPAAPKPEGRALRWAPLLLGGAVAAVAVIAAPIAAAAIDKPAIPAQTCPDGRRAEPLIGGSAVRLVEPSAKSDLDELDVQHVTSSPVTKWLQKESVFGPIRANTTFMGGLNQRGHDRFAFVNGAGERARTLSSLPVRRDDQRQRLERRAQMVGRAGRRRGWDSDRRHLDTAGTSAATVRPVTE